MVNLAKRQDPQNPKNTPENIRASFTCSSKLEWQVLDRETVFRAPIFTLFRSRRQYACKNVIGDFYYFDSNDWLTVVPLIGNRQTKQYDVILVEQFRHGNEQLVLEFPAGIIDEGEDPKHCALRELAEETGFAAESIQICDKLGVSYPNPAIMSNRTFTYGVLLNEEATQHELRLDDLEALQVHRLPLIELKRLIFLEDSPFNSALMLQSLFWLENSSLFASLPSI